jgi:predicted Zn-dependent peptidase
MLKEGGTRSMTAAQLASRVDSLGSSLDVVETADATTAAMSAMRGQLGDALGILAEVVQAPRFDATELGKLKARKTDEAQDAARSSGQWAISRLMARTLYPASSPYASSGLVPSVIAKVDGAAVRAFHARFYRPKNVEVVLAGDLDAEGARAAVEKAFGGWKGAAGPDAAKVEFPEPAPVGPTRVIVSHRPKSVQSDCVVTELLPERHAAAWPTIKVALQVFGGGQTGRLFLDIREKRSLAYRADGAPVELAHGALPLYAYAGTQAPKTADAVQGLLDDLAGMKTTPPTDDEVATARRYLSDVFAIRLETVGAIADHVARLRELDLPDDYWDTYRAALRTVATADVDDQSAKTFSADHALILVAGDADVIAQPLARFGEVTVVDPERDLAVIRTIPKASGAQ